MREWPTASSGPRVMDRKSNRRILAIFKRAYELEGEEQSSFLDRACGSDPAVRERIEKLLARDRADAPPLDSPAIERLTATPAIGDRFCIHCGANLGKRPHCETPECDRLPNAYARIPGPRERGGKPRSPRETRATPPPTPSRRERPRPGRRRTPQRPAETPRRVAPASDEPRYTLPMESDEAVAVLVGIGRLQTRQTISAGMTTIGADAKSDWHIDDPKVSYRHAAISCKSSGDDIWVLTIRDRDSTNGTFVNGERIDQKRLKNGDVLHLADLEFEVEFLSEAPRQTMQM